LKISKIIDEKHYFCLGVLISCNVSKGIKIKGEGKKCFSKKDREQLILHWGDENNVFEILAIGSIIKDKKSCVGLYQYKLGSRDMKMGRKSKVLKFSNDIFFSSKDASINEEVLKDFMNFYSKDFTSKELNTIRKSFLKGDELYGARFY